MNNKITKKEESNVNKPGLIISLFILVGVIVGLFFFIRWLINDRFASNNGDESGEVASNYNKLLRILNDDIKATRIGEEKLANELTSFSYNENHFYISGYNSETIYYYDVDLSSESLTDVDAAYDFVLSHNIEGNYAITLQRYSEKPATDFIAKYGESGKYHVGQIGASSEKVFATMKKDEAILVMNGVTLSDALDDSYSPISIAKSDSLYNIYNYIATK